MCGIVACKDFRGRSVVGRTIQRYTDQRSRGTQGFGYFLPITNRLSHSPIEQRLLNDLRRQGEELDDYQTSEIMFHHRFPTSTENVRNACHPFSTRWEGFKKNYVMVHNGWLTNDLALQEAHEKLGISYVSEQPDGRFNDSEALLYDLALYLEGHQDAPRARGAIAFVIYERENGKTTKMHFGRNLGSPLKMQYKPGKFLTLASEGKGEIVSPNQLHTFDYATNKMLAPTNVIFAEYQSAYSSPAKYVAPWNRLPADIIYDEFDVGQEHLIWYEDTAVGGVHCHYGTYDNCPLLYPDLFPDDEIERDHLPIMYLGDKSAVNVTNKSTIDLSDMMDDDELTSYYMSSSDFDPARALKSAIDRIEDYRIEYQQATSEMISAEAKNDADDYIKWDGEANFYLDALERLSKILPRLRGFVDGSQKMELTP